MILTTFENDDSIFGALEAGAMGYLTKDAGAREIVQAIQTVHAGEALLDPAVQARVIQQLRAGQSSAKSASALPDDLTPERSPFKVIPHSHLSLHADGNPYRRYASHPEEVMVTCKAGSAAVINQCVFHANYPNRSREDTPPSVTIA